MNLRYVLVFPLLCGVTLSCRTGELPAERPRLPAVTDYYRGIHTSITFELPDSGGYLANGTAVERARIRSILAEVFAARAPELRAVFVVDNPRRPWADIALLRESAKAAGGEAFDAELSNRLPLTGWQTIEPIARP